MLWDFSQTTARIGTSLSPCVASLPCFVLRCIGRVLPINDTGVLGYKPANPCFKTYFADDVEKGAAVFVVQDIQARLELSAFERPSLIALWPLEIT